MTPVDPARDAASRPDGGRRGSSSPPDDGAARHSAWSGLDQSSIMSVELLGGIAVWGGIGWLLDGWLGTEPWLLGVGVLGGFCAGLYLVWLRSNEPRHDPSAPLDGAGGTDEDMEG
jgi:ATP synthase protein I